MRSRRVPLSPPSGRWSSAWRSARWSPGPCVSRMQQGRPTAGEFRPGRAVQSATPSIGGHPLVGRPYAVGESSLLPEHVDGDTAARVPVAADPEPARFEQVDQALAYPDRAILVEGAVA